MLKKQTKPRCGPELLAYLRSGNLVKTMNIDGTTVNFYDTCYRGLTAEELEQKRERINQAAYACLVSIANKSHKTA